MRRKTGMREGQRDGDDEAARHSTRSVRRHLETRDPEAYARRAVPRALEEASDLEVPERAGRRRAREVIAGEYARGARRRAAPVSSP